MPKILGCSTLVHRGPFAWTQNSPFGSLSLAGPSCDLQGQMAKVERGHVPKEGYWGLKSRVGSSCLFHLFQLWRGGLLRWQLIPETTRMLCLPWEENQKKWIMQSWDLSLCEMWKSVSHLAVTSGAFGGGCLCHPSWRGRGEPCVPFRGYMVLWQFLL